MKRQWHVKRAAIVALGEGGYFVRRERLGDLRDDGLLNWPMHLAEKTWVNLADFERAFRVAVEDSISSDLIERSFAAARARRKADKAYEAKLAAYFL